MNEILASDKKNIAAILEHGLTVAEQYLDGKEQIPPGRFVDDLKLSTLPHRGLGAIAVLEHFRIEYMSQLANSAGPNYFGFVTGGSTPASVVGDWLVSLFDQNACGSNDSIAPQIEKQTIGFLKDLFGLDEQYFGSFVTGATISNFVGLALGRQWIGEQHGIDFSNEGLGAVPIRIISATPHSSVLKSMSMAGIGRKALVKIDTLPEREAIDIEKLEQYLLLNPAPAIVVANAGTVNTVDFDDLEAIGRLKERFQFWLHVDAAFGGFASSSPRFDHLMRGINYADSITVDAHKWLNVPYDAAMQFTRHKNLQLKIFQNSAAYLGDPEKSPDFFHYTPENSRRFRALPSWFSLMAYGKDGHAEIVERNCACAFELGEKIRSSHQFRLLAPVRMNVVCFTVNVPGISMETIQRFFNLIRDDGRVFFTPTIYKGTPALRAAISNWQTTIENIHLAFEVLTEVWESMTEQESIEKENVSRKVT